LSGFDGRRRRLRSWSSPTNGYARSRTATNAPGGLAPPTRGPFSLTNFPESPVPGPAPLPLLLFYLGIASAVLCLPPGLLLWYLLSLLAPLFRSNP